MLFPFSNAQGPRSGVDIPPVTANSPGLMTPDLVLQIARATSLSIWNTEFEQTDLETSDGEAHTVAVAALAASGVMAVTCNVVASTSDGSDWAVWAVFEAVFAREAGVLTVASPTGPQAPTSSKPGGATSATWKVTFAADGGAAVVRVTGAPGVDVVWSPRVAGCYNRRTL